MPKLAACRSGVIPAPPEYSLVVYQQIEAELKRGKPVALLADLHGLHCRTLRWRLRKLGLQCRSNRPPSLQQRVWELKQAGLANAEIAERLGRSLNAVAVFITHERMARGIARRPNKRTRPAHDVV